MGCVASSTYHEDSAPARGKVSVVIRSEDTEDVVILVHRLAVVSLLNGVPPFAVRITMLPLDRKGRCERRVRVVAVLRGRKVSAATTTRPIFHVVPEHVSQHALPEILLFSFCNNIHPHAPCWDPRKDPQSPARPRKQASRP